MALVRVETPRGDPATEPGLLGRSLNRGGDRRDGGQCGREAELDRPSTPPHRKQATTKQGARKLREPSSDDRVARGSLTHLAGEARSRRRKKSEPPTRPTSSARVSARPRG